MSQDVHAVELRGLRKVYPGRDPVIALDGIDLTIAAGEFVALLGPSGCGKSTLLNLIAGFEQANQGVMRIAGHTVTQAQGLRPGPDRAVVFQESALFPWLTVRDNVTFSPRIRGRRRQDYAEQAQRFIDLVGLSGFERHYPDQLSGGMRQRVGIARCLLMQPTLFLMDEPFGALDAQTRLQMQELLLTVWDTLRHTVVFITHDIEEAIFLADTVYVMSARPGRIALRLPITLPRPRRMETLLDPAFTELRAVIMQQLRH